MCHDAIMFHCTHCSGVGPLFLVPLVSDQHNEYNLYGTTQHCLVIFRDKQTSKSQDTLVLYERTHPLAVLAASIFYYTSPFLSLSWSYEFSNFLFLFFLVPAVFRWNSSTRIIQFFKCHERKLNKHPQIILHTTFGKAKANKQFPCLPSLPSWPG